MAGGEREPMEEAPAGGPAPGRWRRIPPILLRALGIAALVVGWLWAGGFLLLHPRLPAAAAAVLGGGWLAGWPAAALLLRGRRRAVLASLAGGTALLLLHFLALHPPAAGPWREDVSRVVGASVEGDRLRLRDVRDFRWRTEADYDPAWRDLDLDLRDLAGADFLVIPFGAEERAAHTMLCFRFRGGPVLAVSVEVRKRPGEAYSVLRGIYRNYALHYVVALEEDPLVLRAACRGDTVYLHPLSVPSPILRDLLLAILRRAAGLGERPDFYNTLTDNCTLTLARHAGEAVPGAIPFSWKLWVNAHAGEILHDEGYLDAALPFPEAKRRARVEGRIREAAGKPGFSDRIRRPE